MKSDRNEYQLHNQVKEQLNEYQLHKIDKNNPTLRAIRENKIRVLNVKMAVCYSVFVFSLFSIPFIFSMANQ